MVKKTNICMNCIDAKINVWMYVYSYAAINSLRPSDAYMRQ